MNHAQEELVRANGRALLAAAAEHRRGHQLVRARRLARRAERHALRARLHFARLL